MARPIRWILLLSPLLACEAAFDPPSNPPHTVYEDGYAHARGFEEPFLCHDPVSGRAMSCAVGRPESAALSCDASGCHGDFDYDVGPTETARSLRGSDGPSCYACHDRKWNNTLRIGSQ